ncbi:sugar kinase [Staphylococcus ratti]|uniref:Sugar kinase n=1 Tax=Staphylococcus ratti TaxID=2892440 RepID=A0ABY3PD13_9STAP|nr:sugar kinase [Staphylococcus ratti]UEX90217.1 sugar kinase [Staphylococcus ratti]
MSVITLGEILLRLSTMQHKRLQDSEALAINFGGAEMNVAIGLSGLGVSTAMLSAVPNNVFGNTIIQTLRKYSVNTEGVYQKKGRLGLYFVEEGYGNRPSKIIYDRSQSVFSHTQSEDFDLEQLMDGYQWFHFTGITPALNAQLFSLIKRAIGVAKSKNMKISCDLNFRSQLWDFQTARQKMSELLYDVDLIFGYEPITLLNEVTGKDKKEGLTRNPPINVLRPLLKEIHETYDITYIAFTQRKNFSPKRNRLHGYISTINNLVETEFVDVEIVDRIGTGDAFSVGILYGLIQQWSLEKTVDFGIQNMCFKHTIPGDFCFASLSEIQTVIHKDNDIDR